MLKEIVLVSVFNVIVNGAIVIFQNEQAFKVNHISTFGVGQFLFRYLLGREIPDADPVQAFGPNHAICHLHNVKTLPAAILYKIVRRIKEKGEKKSLPDLNILFIFNMPLRAISKLTAGAFSSKMADDLVLALNGHFFRGTGQLIADFFRNKREGKAFLKK